MSVRRERAERLADEELMPLIGEKDPDAFEVFYDRHGGVAYSLAYRIVGERGAAEDVTQEAFISIWRSGARYDAARGCTHPNTVVERWNGQKWIEVELTWTGSKYEESK